VGHDNSGHNPGWLLHSLSILNRTKGWEHTMHPQAGAYTRSLLGST